MALTVPTLVHEDSQSSNEGLSPRTATSESSGEESDPSDEKLSIENENEVFVLSKQYFRT
jgi:hypothetical protein